MNFMIQQISNWIKDLLVAGVLDNLTGLFDSVNSEVGSIATEVATTPESFSPAVFSLIRNVSETVITPVAGIILTFLCCYELIQMIMEHNNLANLDTWMFFKWVFKTWLAVMLITNCFNITMAVFDVASSVVGSSGSLISASTAVSVDMLDTLEDTLNGMDLFPLFGLYLQTFLIRITMFAMSIVIFVIVYGRMIEIYLMTSLAPIPFATFGNREQSQIGMNYLRSLIALGFQGFLILVCVGIYAVLIQTVSISSNVISSLWGVVGYTVLLVFSLFHSGNLARSVMNAH
ncbi:MAG: hypothetical protein LUI13_11420 [Lachnospiraceae bacterium]|nr:hypothetical protein [Lachnospiraceae bacterium]